MADPEGAPTPSSPAPSPAILAPGGPDGGGVLAAHERGDHSTNGESVHPASGADPLADSPKAGGRSPADVLAGRPDLSQNTIEVLRARNKELKREQRQVKQQLHNQKRKRARVIKRMRNLDTASVLQVLMDRGIDFAGATPQSAGAGSSSDPPARSAPKAAVDAAAAAAGP